MGSSAVEGVSGSRTGNFTWLVALLCAGSRIGAKSVLSSARSIDQAVCVDGRISLVRGNLVMQVGRGGGPVPNRQDDIALDALRPRRRHRWQFAGGNPVRPIGKQRQGAIRVEPPNVLTIAPLAWPD